MYYLEETNTVGGGGFMSSKKMAVKGKNPSGVENKSQPCVGGRGGKKKDLLKR